MWEVYRGLSLGSTPGKGRGDGKGAGLQGRHREASALCPPPSSGAERPSELLQGGSLTTSSSEAGLFSRGSSQRGLTAADGKPAAHPAVGGIKSFGPEGSFGHASPSHAPSTITDECNERYIQ